MNEIEKFMLAVNPQRGIATAPSGRLMPKLVNRKFDPTKVGAGLPGEEAGLDVDQVRKFNKSYALKQISFTFTVPANDSSFKPQIDMTGNAWCLIGFSVHAIDNFDDDSAMPKSVTMVINEDQVIDSASWTSLETKYMTGENYRPFERFMNGRDILDVSIDNTGALDQEVCINFYYK